MKRKSDRPTESELEILKVLWKEGSATVREVYDALGGKGSYTTVLKFLQIMADKGLATRDESQRAHCYTAAVAEEDIKRNAVHGLAGKLFGGSRLRLDMHAIREDSLTDDELAEIRALIEAHENKDK